MVDNDGLRR